MLEPLQGKHFLGEQETNDQKKAGTRTDSPLETPEWPAGAAQCKPRVRLLPEIAKGNDWSFDQVNYICQLHLNTPGRILQLEARQH